MLKASLSILILLVALQAAAAQSMADACHVYLIDVEAAQKASDDYDRATTNEQREKALSGGIKILGKFSTKVAEEEMTTRTFPFPGSNYVITASVYYTDEMMASSNTADSMLLGIVVSDTAQESALNTPNNAVAEVTYNQFTDVVRVKTNVKLNNRSYLVGLQCNLQPKPAPK
ncbi:MAG TPA: hypothetical protein VEQ40_12750 [Pyrinomonadaceae bacterium]|nr:hypothetical protein [Pyrinomonadaceae bacterium]